MADKYIEFFDYVKEVVPSMPEHIQETFEELYNYYIYCKPYKEEKPLFTDTGIQILKYLQECQIEKLKAKDIAEGMEITSRKVSGAMRKLVSDGFVSKFGQNQVIYSLTEEGKEFNIANYEKENNNA